jgi:hypothetical protein
VRGPTLHSLHRARVTIIRTRAWARAPPRNESHPDVANCAGGDMNVPRARTRFPHQKCADPVTGAISAGVPLGLTFNVARERECLHATDRSVSGCVALRRGRRLLRRERKRLEGAELPARLPDHRRQRGGAVHDDLPGLVRRARSAHSLQAALFAGSTKTYEFTSQFFFDESLTDTVHAMSPYSGKGRRNTFNTTDGIYNSLSEAEKTVLTLQASKDGDGYAGVINLGVNVG